jgi:hypothetical protein
MHIDKYKTEDGEYLDENGTTFTDELSFLQVGILGFCCCGDPETSLAYIRDRLEYIKSYGLVGQNKISLFSLNKQCHELFHTTGEMFFFFYSMDKLGLTEHGSSVPGWLTVKGENFLSDINDFLANAAGQPTPGEKGQTQ